MEAKTTLEDYNKNPEEDTSSIIEDARRKLEEVNSEEKEKHEKIKSESKGKHKDIESESKGKKKKIILDSASALEGRYREDTIAMVLVQGLKGVASERFIHQCLPEKYKQKHRVLNAKKQKKKKAAKEEEKLATIIPMKTPLNSQIEGEKKEDKKKQVVLVNADGSTSIQNDDGESDSESESDSDSDSESPVTGNPFKVPDYHQQQSFQQEKNDYEEIRGYPDYEESSLEKSNTDGDDELHKEVVTSAVDAAAEEDKMISTINNDKDRENNILRIEYSIYYKELQGHMALEYKKSGVSGKIYFNCKINKDTGRVLSFNIGRLDHKQ